MWLLFVEAGVAMMLLVIIVWWTMFSGARPPPRPLREEPRSPQALPPAAADATSEANIKAAPEAKTLQ
jgi:hypothetical protein